MVKYICNNCTSDPCTIGMTFDYLLNHNHCIVDGDNTAEFKKHTPDPVRMSAGKPELNCSDMPCHLKIPGSNGCVRSGDDCDAVHNTINRYGVIVGMKIIKKSIDNWDAEFDLSTLIKDSAEGIISTI